MTGTDAMDAYLTGEVNRQAESGTRITTAAATTSTTTYLHLHNHQQHSEDISIRTATMSAPQQQYLGQEWEKIRRKHRPCSGSPSRSLGRGPRVEKKNGRVGTALFAQPAVQESLHVEPHRPCNRKEENIYLPSRSAEEKIITVQLRRRKRKLPSRPAMRKNIYRPVPRREKYLPSRPVVKICPVEFYIPSRPVEKLCTRCPVPPKCMSLFFHPVQPRCHFFPHQQVKSVPSVPPRFSVTVINLAFSLYRLRPVLLYIAHGLQTHCTLIPGRSCTKHVKNVLNTHSDW